MSRPPAPPISSVDLDALLKAHTPSLTEAAEKRIDEALLETDSDFGMDYADAAKRDCSCGAEIDGFYEYINHLRAVATQYTGGLA